MSQDPDARLRGDRPDPEPEIDAPDERGQDLHPAVDPREAANADVAEESVMAPPLDIDQRDDAPATPAPPEVIALPDHGDITPLEEPDIAEPESGNGETMTGSSEPDSHPLEEEPVKSWTVVMPEGQERGSIPGRSSDDAEPASTDDGPSAPVSSRIGEAASKLGLGRLLETSDGRAGSPGDESGSPTGGASPPSGAQKVASRVTQGVRAYLDPRLHVATTVPHRRVAAMGALLILLALLANSGGLALILLSAIVPILIVVTLTQHDVFERESNLLVAAVGLGGVIVGIVLSLISSWIQSSQWFDTGVLNYGAAGFGGRFADAANGAPFIVWLIVGLILPAIAMAGIAGIPIALRRWPQFRNEVMDGMILAGTSAAGFAIGTSIVYWWPMIDEPGPRTDVSDWTLTIIGAALLRTAVVTLCGAMVGAGIWRYMVTPSAAAVVLPAVGGVAGYLLLTFGSVQLQPAGLWPEFLWAALLLTAVFMLYRRVLDQAVTTDRQALGNDQGRLVCPSCHRVTPAGAFCARCGRPLPVRNTVRNVHGGGVEEDDAGRTGPLP